MCSVSDPPSLLSGHSDKGIQCPTGGETAGIQKRNEKVQALYHILSSMYIPCPSSRFIQINSLSFSTDDLYLVSSSNTETVHVFRLVDPPQEK